MAKIVQYEIHILKRATVVLATSYGNPPQEKEHVVLKLTDENGVSGWGESTPLPKFTGETIAQVRLLLETEYLPYILGMDSAQIAAAHMRMDKHLPGNHAAQMAVDTAMFDLHAKALGVPLYQLLGGKVRDAVRINRHLGIMSISEAQDKAARYRQDGYTSIKMKVGGNVDDDIARIKAVRQVMGPDAKLRIDANGGYTYSDAMRLIRNVYDCDLEMYEQLLPKSSFEDILALKRNTGVPIGADEAINSVSDAIRYAEHRAADIFTLKLVKTGGLWNALAIARIAQAAGITCVVASTYDTQLNGAACLHLAAVLPCATIGNDITCFATQPDQAKTCHRLENGELSVGSEPGIGVQTLKELCLSTAPQQQLSGVYSQTVQE